MKGKRKNDLEYGRKYATTTKRIAYLKKHKQSKGYKLYMKIYMLAYMKKYRKTQSLEKNKARYTLGNYVRLGKIIRPKECSKCGLCKKIEAHHEDYKKPLNVTWLCKGCHEKTHHQIYSHL